MRAHSFFLPISSSMNGVGEESRTRTVPMPTASNVIGTEDEDENDS